jgi:chemotaxis protein MotB
MSDRHPEIIIVKRKGSNEDAHHGGAWKIAFADFMTAMMAFFLVLWIINATDKDTKTVIARYFNPVKLENPARANKGVHGMDSSTKILTEESSGDQAPGSIPAPEGKDDKDAKSSEGAPGVAAPKKDEKAKTGATRAVPPIPVEVKPTASEAAIFSDPYQTLDRIAGGRAALSPAAGPDTGTGEPTREAGANSIAAFRDPFKPIGPGAVGDSVSLDSDTRKPPSPGEIPDLEPQRRSAAAPVPTPTATPIATPSPDAAAEPSKTPRESAAPAVEAAPEARENEAAEALAKDLARRLGSLDKSSASPAIDVKATKEGLLISLTDRLTFNMFAIGSAEPRPQLIEAMDAIARSLKTRPGAIVLRGYTDARPYKTATYDNWRLSSARAQMAYYMLTRAGIPETRIEQVEGHADRDLRDPAHPFAAENRRIEILVREPKP